MKERFESLEEFNDFIGEIQEIYNSSDEYDEETINVNVENVFY